MELTKKDERPPKGGWAPGFYECNCLSCGIAFEGDKRARQCADCAYSEDAKSSAKNVNRYANARRYTDEKLCAQFPQNAAAHIKGLIKELERRDFNADILNALAIDQRALDQKSAEVLYENLNELYDDTKYK